MKDQIATLGKNAFAYRIAAAWFILFTISALCTAIIGALTGKNWAELTGQDKFIIVVCIIGNWTGVIMAFISNASKKLTGQSNLIPGDDTSHITKP